jgi:integrase
MTLSQRSSALPALSDGLLARFAGAQKIAARSRHADATIAIARRFAWRCGRSAPTRALAERYLADLAARGASAATVRNHASALSVWCKWLVADGVLAANPCKAIRLPRREVRLPIWLTESETEEALRVAERVGVWPAVALDLNTGLRMGELARLRWPDVDWQARMLTVRLSKTGRGRFVPLNDQAMEALRRQRTITGILAHVFPARHTWKGGWKWVDQAAGETWWGELLRPLQEAIPKFRLRPGRSVGRGWHLFRHTFATRLAQAGVSPLKIQRWLGHASIQTTMIYTHVADGYDAEIERCGTNDAHSAPLHP